MTAHKLYIYFLASTLLFLTGCIEEIDFIEESFESALVIDATITNEDKKHEIFLSRTYPFEEDGPDPARNASVKVIGDGVEYVFEEADAGVYISEIAFAAQPNVDYQLQFTTQNGRSYISSPTQLTQNTQIDNLYAERETNDDGVNGMSMYVDSFDPTGKSMYYRYEYEETFKVVPPHFINMDLIEVLNPADLITCCPVELVFRSEDKRICYRTENSRSINLTTTTALSEDRVSRHLIRFVHSDDYKISFRYSILVRQYVQSKEAYSYLEKLSGFSGAGSLFSQVQPGFLTGNIVSESNPEEKVIGFFEVSSVSTKRIFFNYDDFYPGEPIPPYINSCRLSAPRQCITNAHDDICGGLLVGIRNKTKVYKSMNNGIIDPGGPYIMVDRVCGDCTALGEPNPPDFWVE